MLVFLDFDGVLHPFPCEEHQLFCQVPVLEQFFNQPEYAAWEIVVSSTWRERYSLSQLQAFFSPQFAKRIIGVTPVIHSPLAGEREREILQWLQDNGRQDEAWIALDDLQVFFAYHLNKVFLCDGSTGLTEADFPVLAWMIERNQQPVAKQS